MIPRSPLSYIPLILCAILASAYYLSTADYHVSVLPGLRLPSLGGAPAQCDGNNRDVADVDIPPGVRVVAIVFFGRREYVKVLDCYLKVYSLLMTASLDRC
jgi:hypothetical protein